jgi:dsDNA-binding SOS-regulon protein
MPFLIQNNILAEVQNGFRKNKLTVTVCQSFIESIQEALDSGLYVIGLFFDLSKAYDVIDHDILLDKLDSHGIRGVPNMWFRSYLLNQCQFVEIKDTEGSVKTSYNSSCRIVKYGAPQGSVLGPLLFLLYINDLTENVQGAKLVLYADNTNVLITGKDEVDLQNKIMKTMKELQTWFQYNKLIINTKKTSAMSFHPTQRRDPLRPQRVFKNIEIVYQSELRFLGIHMTETLKWCAHA